jgi:membrane fusion protein, heavy metal efflux system
MTSSQTPRALAILQRPKWLALAIAAAVLLLVPLVWTLTSGTPKSAPPLSAAARATPYLDGKRIRFSEEFAKREGVTLAEATQKPLTPTLSVTGQVTYDSRQVAVIGARIPGRIRQVYKVEGERVRAGETMAALESVDLGRAQAQVMTARAKETFARLDEARERRLADSQISAEREAQAAKAAAEASTVERAAAEKAVIAMGGTVDGEVGVLRLKSPIDGEAVEVHARRGATVEPKDTLFVVADLSKVWVEFAVFERELLAVRTGDAVRIHLPSDASRSFEGTISHVGHRIDLESRSGSVRVELENKDGVLRPGLSVTGQIKASGPSWSGLVIPKASVVQVDGKATAFVSSEDGVVEPRTIKLGASDDVNVSVLDGLQAGDRVVVNGLLAIKAELFR